MNKITRLLPIALSIATCGCAAENSNPHPQSADKTVAAYDAKGTDEGDQQSPRRDSRWIKDPAARKEYLKGHQNFRQSQRSSGKQVADNGSDEDIDDGQKSGSRFYRSHSGRQEYLKGGNDHPKTEQK